MLIVLLLEVTRSTWFLSVRLIYPFINAVPMRMINNNLLEIVQHLPSWFPGTHPATLSRRFRPMVEELYNYPFNDVARQMVTKINFNFSINLTSN